MTFRVKPEFKILSFIFLSLILAPLNLEADAHDVPSKPRAPFVAWFEPPALNSRPELYREASLITSIIESQSQVIPKLNAQGTSTLRWSFGPTSAAALYSKRSPGFYAEQMNPFLPARGTAMAGVGIDEWNPGDPLFAQERDAAAAGFREGRRRWPKTFAAAWVTQADEVFISLLEDRTFDLAIIEGYTYIPDVGGLDLQGVLRRCEPFKRAGLLDRAIVCLGYVSATPDKSGRVMTLPELVRLARVLKQTFPEMPGIAFYGTKDDSTATLKLVAGAHEIASELYPAGGKK